MIRPGAAAAKNELVASRISEQFRPGSAIVSTRQVVGKVALFEIPAHSVIVSGMFVDPEPSATSS